VFWHTIDAYHDGNGTWFEVYYRFFGTFLNHILDHGLMDIMVIFST
jgi:hypothetical protein